MRPISRWQGHGALSHPLLRRVVESALWVFVLSVVVSISAMQAAYILALVAWLLSLSLYGSEGRVRLPLAVPVCGFIVASCLASLTAIAPFRSLVELRHVFEVTVFYLAVNTIPSTARATTLLRVLIAVGTLMALYGLGQSLAYGAAFRIQGTMSSYMTYAAQLMLIGSLALAQLLFNRPSWHTRWLVPALLLLVAALVMTHTRNAWLGFAAACLVLLGLRRPVLLLAVPVLALMAFLLAPPAVKGRMQSLVNLQDVTVQERLYMWRSGLRILRDYPFTGIGMGAMPQMYRRYRDARDPTDPNRQLGHLHNNFVQVAAERGLIGLVWWMALWVTYFVHAWRAYKSLGQRAGPAKALVAGSLASVTGFLVAGCFEHNFGDAEVITLTYFLMAFPFLIPEIPEARGV